MFTLVFSTMVLVTLAAVYVFWVRPLLKQTPRFKAFYESEESVFTAVQLKLQGIKQKLTAVAITVASGLIAMHDFVAPYLTGDTVERFTQYIPQWAIPVIPMAIALLMYWLRSLGDRRLEETGRITAVPLPPEPR